jgi:MYXO-CTERM domain-containing protein
MIVSLRSLRATGACMFLASAAFGAAIVPGFNTISDGRNDDGTYTTGGCNNASPGGTCAGTAVNVGFNLNFLGVTFNTLFINTNGNVTLDSPLSTFTPFGLTSTSRQIIAPFFADVDTRDPASGVVTFGSGTFNGFNTFGVNWINVGYFDTHVDKTDSFQLLLVDRSDTGAGNFDIVFNYDNVSWETGDASGGTNGLGGSSAVVGFSNGTGNPGTSFELPGSAVPGALINGGADALITHSLNSTVAGRYILTARNGTISAGTPEPGTWALAAGALAGLVALRRKRQQPGR